MVEHLETIWLDGKLVGWGDADVHLMTHTLHYGVGAFDGVRAYRRDDGTTYLFRLREHVERLFDSCRMLMLAPKFAPEQIERACIDVVRQNRLAEAYVRPMFFVGAGAMGFYAPSNPIVGAVVAWKWAPPLGEQAVTEGIRAKITSFARAHINSGLAKAKVMGHYTNSYLAKQEAKAGGYDEAILLDPNGYVAEASGANVFIVRRGVLYTPDLSSSILEGITRNTVLALARELGLEVREERTTRDQMWLADEAFLTSTANEITPIREIDNRAIGRGVVGPLTKKLQARFFEIVRGGDREHATWLSAVPPG
jgi:branched-chain amino acid aminotransferase